MNSEPKSYRLFFEPVVAIVSAPIVFWCQVPIFIFSLRETPVFLILLTFVAALFLSLSVQVYRFKLFRIIAALYVLGVFTYLVFVSYAVLGIGWWKFLAFVLFAFGLGVAIKRWRAAAWGVILVSPFAISSSLSFTLVIAMLLLLVSYRFFSRQEAVMAALFAYSFFVHAQLLHFYTEPIIEKPIAKAEALLKGSPLAEYQPFSLEIKDEQTLAALYSHALVLLDVNSVAVKFEYENIEDLQKAEINSADGMAIGYARYEKKIFVIDLDTGKTRAEAELGLDADFTGFFGDLGFAVDSPSGVIVFFEPAGISVQKRLETGRRFADVCASDSGIVLVSSSGDIFWVGPDLEQRFIAKMFGYFWFSCAALGNGRFAVASPTSGRVAIVQDGKLLRSIYAGAGVWAIAHENDELYVGNMFLGKVKTYDMSDWKKLKEFKTCRRLKAMAANDKFLFASTQCGLLKLSAF